MTTFSSKDGEPFLVKRCSACKIEKPVEGFYKSRSAPGGLQNACKDCTRARDTGPRAEQKRDYAWKRKLENEFGLTPEDYWEMFDRQGGQCAICRCVPDWKRLAVDHDHETGEIRGLLCNQCNCGLGFFKDDPALIMQALGYLKA
jgi:hypothetical protein